MNMKRNLLLPAGLFILALGAWLWFTPTSPRAGELVEVYKSPTCGCCNGWIEHLEQAGFSVKAINEERMDQVKRRLGVPDELASCHTARVGGYLVEGHVPAADIRRLLAEKPEALGIAVPGMPIGSPGMEMPGTAPEAYDVLLFGARGGQRVFAAH